MAVVAHNLISQFTNRQLNMTTNSKAKSSEKLASGYRINRSADDAAGLQISEKMRSQIRGLNQASRNIQDGISLCQVADGALNETHAVLQRMRELSVQAANDTNTDADRDAIQQEISALTDEIDRIAETTSFNHEIFPLKGYMIKSDDISNSTGSIVGVRQFSYVNDAGEKRVVTFGEGKRTFTCWTDSVNKVYVNGNAYSDGDTVDLSFVTMAITDFENPGNPDMDTGLFWGNGGSSFLDCDTLSRGQSAIYPYYSRTLADLKSNKDGYLYFDCSNAPVAVPNKYLFLYANEVSRTTGIYKDSLDTPAVGNGCYLINIASEEKNNSSGTGFYQSKQIRIQAGAYAGQSIVLSTVDATAKGVGITDPALDVTSYNNASTSISRLDDAINRISGYRSNFGAQQNRLEHAMAVDDNAAENTQYAESRIRDTDMAKEMVQYSKSNILEQVGQSMLAQANQSNQGIISLLS